MRLNLFVLLAIMHRIVAFPSHFYDDSEQIYDSIMDYEEDIFYPNGDIFASEDTEKTENTENSLTTCLHVVCAPHHLCINDIVVINSTGSFEWRSSINNGKKSKCQNFGVQCCADNLVVSKIVSQPINELAMVSSIGQCGLQYNNRNSAYRRLIARAIHSETAEPMEFPWMVAIFKRLNNGRLQFIGAGSIIHSHIILTAAHLLKHIRPDQLVIRAGAHNIVYDSQHQQQKNVSRILIHENFEEYDLVNDIALIVVDKNLEWTRYVNPICLPPPNQQTQIKTKCMASGWGQNSFEQNDAYQSTLQKIDLPIVQTTECQQLLQSTELGTNFRLHPSLLCAGGSGKDMCKGDGGSPLVCPIPNLNNRYYQCGIVAGGVGCDGHLPAMYVNVAYFVDWINKQLRQINLSIDQPNVLLNNLF